MTEKSPITTAESSRADYAATERQWETHTYKQRRFWMPWIVEWITEAWTEEPWGWVVVSRVRVKP